MGVKINTGRGKKGDGLKIDKRTKKRSYGQARTIGLLSLSALRALLENPNTRRKDIFKINQAILTKG